MTEQQLGTGPSDAQLIVAVRSGDPDAYGTLYERHEAAARTHAGRLAPSPADADDLVADAFARVFAALRAGRGPDRAFRAYLLTTLRNGLYERVRRDRRLELTDDMGRYDGGEPWTDTLEAELDAALAARAFLRLPERWQSVLWYSEVERQSAAEIGLRLGLRPNAVAALAFRAREGLRQAYLQEHLSDGPDRLCRPAVQRLARYTRGTLVDRDAALVREHLDECERCRRLAGELADVNGGIRALLLGPLVTAGPALAGPALGGSTLGWLAGSHLGQAAAAVLAAAVIGGTAVVAQSHGVGIGGQGQVAAAVARPPAAARTDPAVSPPKATTAARAAAPGRANGHAKGHAKGAANGRPNGTANGRANGNATGNGNGNANGAATGNANDPATGNANGAANGNANGAATGNANGRANGQANGAAARAQDKAAPRQTPPGQTRRS